MLLQNCRRLLIEVTQYRGFEDPEIGKVPQRGPFEVLKTAIGTGSADDTGDDQCGDGTCNCDDA